MSKVARIVAYPELWRHPRFPKDFCFALDATMVRLWFDDADARLRSEIRRRVQSGAPGRFLSAEERRELHLDFQDRLYGDEIYLLEPGTAIYPNFHSLQRPKAMHAYHPDDPDQHGIFITSEAFPQDVAELTDVTDVCRTVLGLPDRPMADAHAD